MKLVYAPQCGGLKVCHCGMLQSLHKPLLTLEGTVSCGKPGEAVVMGCILG